MVFERKMITYDDPDDEVMKNCYMYIRCSVWLLICMKEPHSAGQSHISGVSLITPKITGTDFLDTC